MSVHKKRERRPGYPGRLSAACRRHAWSPLFHTGTGYVYQASAYSQRRAIRRQRHPRFRAGSNPSCLRPYDLTTSRAVDVDVPSQCLFVVRLRNRGRDGLRSQCRGLLKRLAREQRIYLTDRAVGLIGESDLVRAILYGFHVCLLVKMEGHVRVGPLGVRGAEGVGPGLRDPLNPLASGGIDEVSIDLADRHLLHLEVVGLAVARDEPMF